MGYQSMPNGSFGIPEHGIGYSQMPSHGSAGKRVMMYFTIGAQMSFNEFVCNTWCKNVIK
jgi:hypothetical protein